MLNPPKLIGHRGVKDLSPENTLHSISLAKKLGLNWVEIDVKITKDLVPILLHDDELSRTTNGNGLVINKNYNYIITLDAGMYFYEYPTKIHIPSLSDVLIFSNKNNICLNIELKPNLGFELENVKAVAKIILNSSFSNQYYFSSFDLKSLISMKKIIPNAYYGILVDKFNKNFNLKDILDICNKYNITCCGLNKKIDNNEIINQFNLKGIITSVYSDENLNKNEVLNLWSMGVSSVFIDDPSEFKIF